MTPSTTLPDDLVRALDDALDPLPSSRLVPVVERLIGDYRSGRVPAAPILRTADDAAAYAAYRMPATFAAVRDALGRAAERLPGLAPRRMVDAGGGTGAAVWAAADVWPSLTGATVLEGSAPVLELGRRLAAAAGPPAVRTAEFRRARLDDAAALPDTDLVTISYVLGELDDAARAALVAEAARRAPLVAVAEPGTPAGHRRVLAARDTLLAAGLTVVAPCPHDRPCPLAGDGTAPAGSTDRADGADWCHFAARVNRSARHRRLKAGELGHEDEKFSYVVAARTAPAHAPARVVRHPLQRKGLVTLRLCAGPDDGDPRITDRPVPRSRKADFRAARDTSWGDAWPPAPDE